MKPDLDIDSLRTEHESDEQWAVRKAFMEEHKNKFSESELVTLAQLFTNIEFLGCRYSPAILGDMSYLTQNILSEGQIRRNIFGLETEHWSLKQRNGKKSKLSWLYSDLQCTSHLKCCWNKTLVKKLKTMQNMSVENIGAFAKGKPISKASTGALPKLKKPNKIENSEKELESKLSKLKVKPGKMKPVETFKKINPVETVKSTYKCSFLDYNTLNYKAVNRSHYENKMKNKQLHSEDNFIKHNESMISNAKPQIEKPKRELHPFLTEYSPFVIAKVNKEKFKRYELKIVPKKVTDFLKDLDIPAGIVTFYGTVSDGTEIMFTVKDVNVTKFIAHFEFKIKDEKYAITPYEKVKAAIVLPNKEEYLTKNPLQWLEILNDHIDIKPTEWNIIDNGVIDDQLNIYVNIPRKDAITLNNFNYRLNYFEIRVRIVLFPKLIYQKETGSEAAGGNLDNPLSKNKYAVSENINDETPSTSSANVDNEILFINRESQDEIKSCHVMEKGIFSLPFGNKFDIFPLVDIQNTNKDKELEFAQWELLSTNYFKSKLFLALPEVDAKKLRSRKVTLKYNGMKIGVCFPDLENKVK